jgi:hypothetical protein
MTDDRTEASQRMEEGARRAYERPAIAWEEDFEPYVFSTCGKMPGQGGPCRSHQSS